MKQKIFTQAAGLVFFTGFILTCSDGQWFPQANFAGAGIALIGALMLRRADSARHRGGSNGP